MRANIPLDSLSSSELLEDWAWLCKEPYTLIAMTNFGDMFLCNESRGVLFLDLVSGELSRVADSVIEFQRLAANKEKQRHWFLTDLLTEIECAGLALSAGQCFSFKKPPALGGRIELANVETASIAVHISLMGQIHRQMKDLPQRTKIQRIKIG